LTQHYLSFEQNRYVVQIRIIIFTKKIKVWSFMELKGKKFLVTGGAGFVGSHLIDMLLEEDVTEIVIFDNFIRGGLHNLEKAIKDERVKLFEVKGDLTHLDEVVRATQNIDGVFHLASLCLAHCQEFPRSALDVNIVGTYNLLEACFKNNVKRIIFASSSSIYGNAVYSPMDENHPLENRNFYGATKIAGEALFKAFYYKYGSKYLALRFMNVYGPRQDYLGAYVAVIMKIIDRLEHGLPPVIFGDGSQSFDFVFVKDACRSLIAAFESSLSDRCYNISSGKQVSVLELSNLIMRIMKKSVSVEFKKVEDNTLVTDRLGSTEKAKEDLGFQAEVSLEVGLGKVIDWKVYAGATDHV
jgi:UDP-glucose 4-epimerase